MRHTKHHVRVHRPADETRATGPTLAATLLVLAAVGLLAYWFIASGFVREIRYFIDFGYWPA